MAVSDFSSVLSGIYNIYRDSIQALITSPEAVTKCRLIFGSTRLDPCPNCLLSSDGSRSANIYRVGGPIQFTRGTICSICIGRGKVKINPETEDIELIVIWNPKDWIDVGGVNSLQTAAGKIQTLSVTSTSLVKLKRATSLIVATDIEGYESHIYSRDGEPTPIGFTSNDFTIAMWKKYG